MAKSQEMSLDRIFEMLNRMEEAQKETESRLATKLDETKAEVLTEINSKLDDTKLDLSIKLNNTDFKLEQSITSMNDQLKGVIDTVNKIDNRCTVMEQKIDDRCKSLESTLKRAFTEQSNVVDTKMKNHFLKCEAEIAAVHADTERLDEVVRQNKESVDRLKTVVADNENATSAHSDRIKNIDERFEKMKRDFNARTTPTVICQGRIDDKQRILFKGNRFENPIEFLKLCEREMEALGCDRTDSEKVDWVARHLTDSARQWYNIRRDKIVTYTDLKLMLENRYWNTHIQSQIRNKLEYGYYEPKSGKTAEQYVIQNMEQAMNLKPQMSEEEIIVKLSQHFSKTVRMAAFTQGTKTLDDLLVLVAQSMTYGTEDPAQRKVVRYQGDTEQPSEQNKFWKQSQPEKNKSDFQKQKYFTKPYYTQNKGRSEDSKVVHSLTIDKSQDVTNTQKKGKEPTKKYYVNNTKNVIASTSQ